MSTLPGDNYTSSSAPSLDGKGGTESASKRTGPTYVYYRLYTKLGAFESNHPLYYNDRFIARVPTKSFAPPHTVASIRRSLCRHEGLSDPDKALVFIPLSNPAPKEDSARLTLYAASGPGLSERDPIALVVESEERTTLAPPNKLPERSDHTDIHYVYYRIYSPEGKDQEAMTSFDESDISLGRINTLFIAPPHTAGSLKACIAKVEGLVTPGHALYNGMELFQDMNSDASMSDADVISFQGDAYPGSDEGNHVALVNATANTVTDQKAKPTPDGPDSKFTKCARLTGTFSCSEVNKPTWLSGNISEIIHTDGVVVSVRSLTDKQYHSAYMVINSKGEKGLVDQSFVEFI